MRCRTALGQPRNVDVDRERDQVGVGVGAGDDRLGLLGARNHATTSPARRYTASDNPASHVEGKPGRCFDRNLPRRPFAFKEDIDGLETASKVPQAVQTL
jgi:hypothetical protein